jgi:phosphate starvation-inducible membrane PsiE
MGSSVSLHIVKLYNQKYDKADGLLCCFIDGAVLTGIPSRRFRASYHVPLLFLLIINLRSLF